MANVASGMMSSDLVGAAVYNGSGNNAEHVGDIADLVIDNNGQVNAVIIGVGGFLGVGQKDVAVNFKELQFDNTANQPGDHVRVMLAASKNDLQAAPEYKKPDKASATTAQVQTAPSSSTTITTQPAPSATQPAQTAQNAQPQRPAATSGSTATSSSTKVDAAFLTASEIMGASMHGRNDDNIGKVKDLLLKPSGEFDAIVVDIGGFLGIGAKSVAIDINSVEFRKDDRGNLYALVGFTKQQLENATEFKKETYATQRDTMLLKTAAATPAAPAAAGSAAAPTATFTLAAADATKLKAWIVEQKKPSAEAPSGVTVAVGQALPQTIPVYEIPTSVGVASATMYRYATIGDKVVLVTPTDRKIVYVFS